MWLASTARGGDWIAEVGGKKMKELSCWHHIIAVLDDDCNNGLSDTSQLIRGVSRIQTAAKQATEIDSTMLTAPISFEAQFSLAQSACRSHPDRSQHAYRPT